MSHYYSSFPTTHVHSSRPVSSEEAHSLISSYVAAAESDAGLNPNATLAESGPIAAKDSGGGSLIIHSLRRVEAALRGEHLEPLPKQSLTGRESTPEEAAGVVIVPETPTTVNGSARKRRRGADGKGEDDDGEEWQDPEVFEQQQEDVEGEVGDRMTGVAQGDKALANMVGAERSMDKEARKKAKKERRGKEKRDREKARQEASAA